MSNATPSSHFAAAPSIAVSTDIVITTATAAPSDVELIAAFAGPAGDVEGAGFDRAQLDTVGFSGAIGATQLVASADGVAWAAVGTGGGEGLDAGVIRDAAGFFGRASGTRPTLAAVVPTLDGVPPASVAQAIVEGVLMSRYTYDALRRDPRGAAVTALTLVTSDADRDAVQQGADRGRAFAAATKVTRDLANTPHNHLSASKLADLAQELGSQRGLAVEVFGKDELIEMGCGGMLGVNAGSAEPPRLIKLTYTPGGNAVGHLALVGKGIMYDSGGISLKPGDEVHAQMKNDMTGAAAIFGAMCVLGAAGCQTAVTAYLCCTDNMPSGTAMALGDVITMRGGTTVEVISTDAEGRLVMADGLVLAAEESPDAIVDIATLTGACMRALGTGMAGVMGTNPALVEQIRTAGAAVDEPLWELPLEPAYRRDIVSSIADLRNLGSTPNGGAIHAGLFLLEFVGAIPFAHIDIAGVAQTPADTSWRTAGCSGFGARLLLQLATEFARPTAG